MQLCVFEKYIYRHPRNTCLDRNLVDNLPVSQFDPLMSANDANDSLISEMVYLLNIGEYKSCSCVCFQDKFICEHLVAASSIFDFELAGYTTCYYGEKVCGKIISC